MVASCVKISKRSERWREMYEGTSGSVAHTTRSALVSTTTPPLVCMWGEGYEKRDEGELWNNKLVNGNSGSEYIHKRQCAKQYMDTLRSTWRR